MLRHPRLLRESQFARALSTLPAKNEADRGGQVTQMDGTKRDRSLVGTMQAAVVAEIEPDAGTLREESDRAAANVEARDIGLDRQERTARKRKRRRIEERRAHQAEPAGHKGTEAVFGPTLGQREHGVSHQRKGPAVLQPGRAFATEERGREHGDALDAKHPGADQRDGPAELDVGLGGAALLIDERRIPVEGGAEGRRNVPFGRARGPGTRTSAAQVSATRRSMAQTSASARESEEERRKEGPRDVARAKLERSTEPAAVGEENEREMPVRQFHHE